MYKDFAGVQFSVVGVNDKDRGQKVTKTMREI